MEGGTDCLEPVSVPEKKLAERRVSFKPGDIQGRNGDPAELQELPLPPDSDEVDAVGPDKYRGRSRSEVAPTVIERFAITRERKWSITLTAVVAAMPAFLLGLTLGYPSNAILDLTGEASELPPEFFFSEQILSVFTALAPLGAIFGGPVGGWISDHWGRKCGMMFSCVPYLLGYLLLSYAHYSQTATTFNVVLLAGRFITGLGMGWASASSPVYIAENCSAKLRGIYGNFFASFLTVGVLFNYILGAIDDFRYYHISLVAVGIVALFEVLMFWLPETPRWLLSRGYVEKAEQVLLWLRGKKVDIDKELAGMKQSFSKKKKNIWKLFLRRAVLIPLTYILIIFFIQQMGGVNGITPFAGTLLKDAGLSNPRTTATYAVGVAGVVGLFIAFILVDCVGRKLPLVLSWSGQFLATTLLGIHAYITRPSLCDFSPAGNSSTLPPPEENSETQVCNPQFQYMALTSIIFYTLSFTSGANSIPYVLLAELLPLSVRGKASGIASALTWGCSAFFTGVYFQTRGLITPWITLWGVAILDLCGVFFVILFIPETKGKKFEELEKIFVKRPDRVETVL